MANEASAHSRSAASLGPVSGSRVETAGAVWDLVGTPTGLALRVEATLARGLPVNELDGEVTSTPAGTRLIGPLSSRNAAVLRRSLPWLAPEPVGLKMSAGLGDRLGLATPGHVLALRAAGGSIAPVFAQQSIREMTRTNRSAQQVMDAATFGMLEAGWRAGTGADADHLKTTDDIDTCLAAGFTWFTIDPGSHVDGHADAASVAELKASVGTLPWASLEDSWKASADRYVGKSFDIEGHAVAFSEETVLRAVVKYGRAVAHVAQMYRHLVSRVPSRRFDLEVSVDETDTPTTPAEHIYVVSELKRLGVQWQSLAPRFVGRFEKGVDYIGDLGAFEAEFTIHAGIARVFGPYKISLHSGSDKFSIYPIVARHTRGLVHLKTAGTSYLEAIRTVGLVNPGLFREIYTFALTHYEVDRASYHVSADMAKAPKPAQLKDGELAAVLDQFDARQALHCTFGSVLTTRTDGGALLFYDRLMDLLRAHRDVYADCLKKHFLRHLEPFVRAI
jgi:tagaturonate epimerase